MGAIHYYEKERVFKLDTPHTSYLIGIVDEEKFLGHIYYGAKITDYDVRALMRTGEAPFVPSQNTRDRSSFLDAFPMEYPGHGVGDYRESAISVADKNGNTAVQPLYREHKIYAGKPGLPGLPATFGSEEECETLEIVLADEVLDLTVTLYYTAFYDVDAVSYTHLDVYKRQDKYGKDMTAGKRFPGRIFFYGRRKAELLIRSWGCLLYTSIHRGNVRQAQTMSGLSSAPNRIASQTI